MIQSILDTDLYKFTTSYAYFKLYPEARGTFTFNDRAKTEYDEQFVDDLHDALDSLSRLSLTDEEFEYMIANCKYIPQNYFEWLKGFRFESSKIEVSLDSERHLHIEVTDFMYKVTLYEIAVLATVSELVNRNRTVDIEAMISRLEQKEEIARSNDMRFSDFGTRRRFSFDIQQMVVKHLRDHECGFVGTSNCYLAMKLGTRMIGTYPHELPMFIAAVNGGPRNANYLTMEDWVKVFDGYLGTALTIDPMVKTIIFSDALDFPRAAELKKACEGRIRCSFGIGTNLTNDTGYAPCNIVMKLSKCQINRRQPMELCVKLSDVPGKEMGDPREIEVYRYLLRN